MTLTSPYKGRNGVDYVFEYSDADSFDGIDKAKCTQTYAVCFCDGKIVIGYSGGRKEWGLIGGTIELGESFEETLKREVKEESNMEVLDFMPVGYQRVVDTRDQTFIYQLRYVCTVRPYGPFVVDPAGGIDEIKLVDSKEYKEYFDWGAIGDRIVGRAVELLPKLSLTNP